ncbi:siderophore-iron reductase FhuF [Pseudoalteromonas nigrifaciens]|uniref:siderophore-iron reductase FhuF n=1 Tax=Pseudoalteromonas nigrifaciens TaxID=28109 RepID=UPI003FD204FF
MKVQTYMAFHDTTELNSLLERQAPFYSQHFKIIEPHQPLPKNCQPLSQRLNKPHYTEALVTFSKSYQQQQQESIDFSALHSMWGQWFFGFLLPPLLEYALKSQASVLHAAMNLKNWHWTYHQTGRVECFYLVIREEQIQRPTELPITLLERLLVKLINPIVKQLSTLSPVSEKLFYSHVAYCFYWYLSEMPLAQEFKFNLLTQLFSKDTLLLAKDATLPHPLCRKIRLKNSEYPRIMCCLRHKLPNTPMCNICPLNKNKHKVCKTMM